MRPGLLAFALVLGLTGCQGPVTLVVAPEAAGLLPSIQTALGAVERQTGLHFTLEPVPTSPPSDALYFSVDAPVPEALASLPVVNFEASTMVPLFWDPPGVTVFAQEAGSDTGGPRSWANPARGWPRVRGLVIAGAERDLRLAAWLGQSGSNGSLPTIKMFQEFAAWATGPLWKDGTWTLKRPDVAPLYRGGQGLAFVETRRDFLRSPDTDRRFYPFVPLQAANRLVGPVLGFQAFGGTGAQQAAQAWAKLLTDPVFRRDFASRTGWTPVPSAPVVPTSAVTVAVGDQIQNLLPTLGVLSH